MTDSLRPRLGQELSPWKALCHVSWLTDGHGSRGYGCLRQSVVECDDIVMWYGAVEAQEGLSVTISAGS